MAPRSQRLPSLNALRVFWAAARHGSFVKAAGELNVTPSAVSLQVRQLEDELGLKLFERTARGLALDQRLQRFERQVINLSRRGDLVEAAANFFAALRTLDEAGVESIAVMPIPDHGLGEAINDRLKRARIPATLTVSADLP